MISQTPGDVVPISKISRSNIIDALRLDDDELSASDAIRMRGIAVGYIVTQTSQTIEYLDKQPEMYHAAMVLIQDMHDNRSYYVDNKKVNEVVRSIIQLHTKMTL